MKKTNNITIIQMILYKIYFESILLSLENNDYYVIVDDIQNKLNYWLMLLNKNIFDNKELEKIKLTLIDQISRIYKKREIDVYELWTIQNYIDLITIKGKIKIWKK